MNYPFAIFVCAATVLVYMMLGGFKAVVKTDVFQYLSILFLLLVLLFTIGIERVIGALASGVFDASVVESLTYGVLGFVLTFATPDVWQRIYAARSQRDAVLGVAGSGVLIILSGICTIFLGVMARAAFPGIDPNSALVYGLFGLVPAYFGIGAVIVFAAAMSTLDTCVFVLAMNVSRDITGRFRDLPKKNLVKLTRIATFAIIAVTAAFSVVFANVMRIAVITFSLYLTLAPIVIASFFWELKGKVVLCALGTGLAIMVGLVVSGTTYPPFGVIPLFVTIAVLSAGQKLLKG